MASPPPPPRASAVESPLAATSSAVENPLSGQVSKFQDVYSMVRPYCGTFEFEWNPNYDHTKDCDTDDEEDVNHIVDPIPAAIKYVNQIRETFGFDVDCIAPSWLGCCFKPIDMSKAKLNNKILYDEILEGVHLAITEINADLSGSGKRIELVELVKVVEAAAPTMQLLTLKVKEFEQWRFKPDEGDDFWYKAPSVDVARYAAIYGAA